jgi:hypothetical protein
VLWLLDFSDIYQNYLARWLSEEQRQALAPWAEFAQRATPYVILLIILVASLYTFYEVDRQVVRNPKLGQQLKAFYARSGDMLQRQITSDAELQQFRRDYQAWLIEVRKWLAANMEQASRDRFDHSQYSLPYHHPKPFMGGDSEHQRILNSINIYHKNLQALIESQEWR